MAWRTLCASAIAPVGATLVVALSPSTTPVLPDTGQAQGLPLRMVWRTLCASAIATVGATLVVALSPFATMAPTDTGQAQG
ncbi:MAG: hypothetical protein N3C12_11480, partial [Candidatus Binatia bacterium]|nr:hypothetical protein [Candidatus Binatia bacterium]